MSHFFLIIASWLIIFQNTNSYLAPEPNAAFCPLVDMKGNPLYYFDKRFSVPKSTPVRVITECSLACYQDDSCKGFTFGKNSSNCTLHYTFPSPITTTIAQSTPSTSRLTTYMMEGFSLYPYRYPYPCILPFTLAGRLYNDSCAPILPGYLKCNFYVCPVQIGSVVETRQCVRPDNMTQARTSILMMSCFKNMKEIYSLETGKSWILIQHKKRYAFDYSNREEYRNWTDYKQGFGTPDSDYWIGNEWLYGITSNLCMPNNGIANYRLRIEIGDVKGFWYSVEYKYFKVDAESAKYRLNLTGYDELASDLADAFSLADQTVTTQPGTTRIYAPWSIWNCTLPCKLFGFFTNDTRPNENCTLPTGWWFNSTQLNCQTSAHFGNLNSPINIWPNKRGMLPSYIYQSETRMYIRKA